MACVCNRGTGKGGHEFKLIDVPTDGLNCDECYLIAKEFDHRMVVLYTSIPSIYNDIEIGGNIKEVLPDCFIGPHVSALPEESLSLDKRIDAVAFIFASKQEGFGIPPL